MTDHSVYSIASMRMSWLSQRGQVVAGNIANVNTPGYKSKDVVPFDQVLSRLDGSLAATHQRHLDTAGSPVRESDPAQSVQAATLSGNSVDLEEELLRLGRVRSAHGLASSVVSAFHRMFVANVKG